MGDFDFLAGLGDQDRDEENEGDDEDRDEGGFDVRHHFNMFSEQFSYSPDLFNRAQKPRNHWPCSLSTAHRGCFRTVRSRYYYRHFRYKCNDVIALLAV